MPREATTSTMIIIMAAETATSPAVVSPAKTAKIISGAFDSIAFAAAREQR